MAYDEDLAERIRELLGGEPGLNVKKMFGGLAFLIGGNMSIAASAEGGVLVRVDPADSDTLIGSTDAQPGSHARSADAGMAAGGPRALADEASARKMGAPRGHLCSLASCEGMTARTSSK